MSDDANYNEMIFSALIFSEILDNPSLLIPLLQMAPAVSVLVLLMV